MLNIIELERRWFKYKVKSFIPHVSIVLSLSVITIILLVISNNNSISNESNSQIAIATVDIPIVQKIDFEQINKPVTPEKEIIMPSSIQTVSTQKRVQQTYSEKVKLAPSLDFMKKMQNSVQPYYRNETTTTSNDKKTPVQRKKKENIVNAKISKTKILESAPVKSQERIQIKRQNTQNDIHDIIKRFKKNNNPALSLFIAKKYYELGNYRQSYNYSLMTNKINNDIESSWIIFAKSLVKLGKKDKAVQTLKKYIKHSGSNSAEILFDDIKSGKFQ